MTDIEEWGHQGRHGFRVIEGGRSRGFPLEKGFRVGAMIITTLTPRFDL